MAKPLLILLLAFVISLPSLSFAQITIQSSDFDFPNGTVFTSRISSTPFDYDSFNGGVGGPFNWDISAIVFTQTVSSQSVNPSTAPDGGNFPTANMCFTSYSSWSFLQRTSSEVLVLGNVLEYPVGTYTVTQYSPTEVSFVFPLTNGTTWSTWRNTVQILPNPNIDSIVTRDSIRFTCDAYGTMKYKASSMDCLRLRENDFSIIKTWRGTTLLGTDTSQFEMLQFVSNGYAYGVNMIKQSTPLQDYYSTSADARFVGTATAVGDVAGANLPGSFAVEQNSPNPFNPTTTIRYRLDKPSPVTLEVVNSLGETVSRQDLGVQSVGTHELSWDADKAGASTLPSGVYFYRLTAGTQSAVKRMVLLK